MLAETANQAALASQEKRLEAREAAQSRKRTVSEIDPLAK